MKKISRAAAPALASLLLAVSSAGAGTVRPLAFEENRGQTEAQVRFLARGPGYGVFLTPSEAVIAPRGGGPIRLRWLGARPAPAIAGEGELPGRSHYLLGGDPAHGRTDVPSWARVRYRGVYPGTDLVFHGSESGNPRQLEYDFIVAPGADPRAIRLALQGAGRPRIDAAGDLVFGPGERAFRLRRPAAYQETGGVRRAVAAGWRLFRGGQAGFRVGAYDPARPLVIDPVLAMSTYLGGAGDEIVRDIAVAADGSVYVAGFTTSPDFPAAGRPPRDWDAFVTKLDPRGVPVFTTFVGGRQSEEAAGLAVDAAGFIYLTGFTSSIDFPRVNPVQPRFDGTYTDAFVAKLRPDGAALVYATNLGGMFFDRGDDIAVDPAGNAYVTGTTMAPDFPLLHPLPVPPPRPRNDRGFEHAFVTKLTPAGALAYSTYLGGDEYELATAIAVDSAGHAYVAGITGSADFPTVAALKPTYGGEGDGYLAELDASGSSLIFSTYLGGNGWDLPNGLRRTAAGLLYLAGITTSDDLPLVRPVQAALRGESDLFVMTLSPDASSVVFATLLGGSSFDNAQDLAVDRDGRIFVTGNTLSTDFPLQDAVQAACAGAVSDSRCIGDAFVTEIDPAVPALVFSTYLGGGFEPDFGGLAASDGGEAIAVGPQGDAWVAGLARSTDFPTVQAFQPDYGGASFDAFVAHFAAGSRPPDCAAASASPGLLWPPNGKLVPLSIRGVTDPDGDPVTLRFTSIRQDEPLSKKGQPDAAGLGTGTAQVRADRSGDGDGRVYRLAFEAADGRGGSCTGEVTVCVPHDQGRRTCGDGGALYDSTGSQR